MRTAYLDRPGMRIEFENGTIVLRAPDGQRLGTLPGKNLERLILQGEMLCSTGAVRHLLEQGASVLWLSARRSHAVAQLHGGLHAHAQIRLQQYRRYHDTAFRVRIAQRILRAKLQSQQRQVEEWLRRERSQRRVLIQAQESCTQGLDSLASAASIDALMGVEGRVAHSYFQALFTQVPPAVSSEVRSRRPPRDPINVLLSLGYTLAHHEAVAAAYAVGLDPYIGFLHEIAAGRESVACDLTEFLRQMVDGWVVTLLQEETLRKEHFSRENDGSCLLGKAGRAHFYRAWARIAPTLRRLARRYARWMVASMQEYGEPAA